MPTIKTIDDFCGAGCPNCGRDAVVVQNDGEHRIPDTAACRTESVRCQTCDRQWTNVFTFTHAAELVGDTTTRAFDDREDYYKIDGMVSVRFVKTCTGYIAIGARSDGREEHGPEARSIHDAAIMLHSSIHGHPPE